MAVLSFGTATLGQGLENYGFVTGTNGSFYSPTFTELIPAGKDDYASALTDIGFAVYGGEHAPYLWVKTPKDKTSWRFFEELLYGIGVVCTPGVGFGPSGEGYFRLTAFSRREDCEEALQRMRQFY